MNVKIVFLYIYIRVRRPQDKGFTIHIRKIIRESSFANCSVPVNFYK